MKWIKSGLEKVKIKLLELPDGSFAVGIINLDRNSQEWVDAVSLGFKPSATGRTLLRAGKIKFFEIKSFLKNASVVDIPEDQVIERRRAPKTGNVISDTQASRYLGLNYLGRKVYETALGGRYINGQDGESLSEESIAVAAAFLRVKEPGDLEFCADGFVHRMGDENLRPADIKAFCATIYGEKSPVSDSDARLRIVQENIESAVFRRVAEFQRSASSDADAFWFANHLLSHQPEFVFRTSTSIGLQQYSTPITLSVAAQHALGDVSGATVLEPTIGNASLVSGLSAAMITGVEIEESRFSLAKKLVKASSFGAKSSVVHGDFLKINVSSGGEGTDLFDAVISNPPFGGLASPVKMTVGDNPPLNVTRLDHQILMRALQFRKDDGRAVFIIGADHDNIYDKNAGVVSGGSVKLFAWLADHYEVRVFEVDGAMYRKQGSSYPVRVVAVGRRYTPEEATSARQTKAFRFDKVPVVDTPEDLWNQAVLTRSFLHKSVDFKHFEEVDDSDENPSFGNDYQSQYTPMAKGNTSAMIPSNLVVPQQRAFERFLERHPEGPEAFVMKELGIKTLDGFEPEQVDAVAMGIWNIKRGRGLILADQTGMGKGRIVAALAWWAASNEIQTNFMSEKEGLFSDLYRDIRDIGAEDAFTPFMMNSNARILSTDGDSQELIHKKTPAAVRQTVLESGIPAINSGYNLVLSTYSQFNRSAGDSLKARWISGGGSSGALTILDESHNAAGDSNTGRNISFAIQESTAAVYSSATFAKNADNMGIYYKAFPSSVDVSFLTEAVKVGGEPLQEVLSSMLCEDGVFLRRERDLSALKFKVFDVPEDLILRNERISDQVGAILSDLAGMSQEIARPISVIDKDLKKQIKDAGASYIPSGKPIGVSSSNFGSRLFGISRQIALVYVVNQVADAAVEALKNGQKPVIVMEQTMDAAIDAANLQEEGSENLLEDVTEDGVVVDAVGRMRQLSLRDLLVRMIQASAQISIRDDYGNSRRVSVFDLFEEHGIRSEVEMVYERLLEKVSYIEDLPAMPLDIVADRIRKAGYTCGEISGRKHSYTFNEDGSIAPSDPIPGRSASIFKFNNGETDAVLLTRAGSTGISLHSSENFSDQRQRVMLIAQVPLDVNVFMQFLGRVDRRGQITAPEIWSFTSGLPWENRMLAMQNAKIRKLSANTQSNRNNVAENKDIPDIINSVGDEVCREFLTDNPNVAAVIGIDFSEIDQKVLSDNYFVNRLTGRMSLLPVEKQKEIYREIGLEYDSKIKDLNSRGLNPLEQKILDVKAEVIQRVEIHSGDANESKDDSVFNLPMYAEKLEWEQKVVQPKAADVVRMANAYADREAIGDYADHLFLTSDPNNPDLSDCPRSAIVRTAVRNRAMVKGLNTLVFKRSFYEEIRDSAKRSKLMAIPSNWSEKYKSEEAAVAAMSIDKTDGGFVYQIHEKEQWLYQTLQNIVPGAPVHVSTPYGSDDGIVMALRLPPPGARMHLLGQYEVEVIIPSMPETVKMSLSSLYSDDEFRFLEGVRTSFLRFDSAPDGMVTFSRWTITGNLYRASEIAAKQQLGRVGIYTNKNGERVRAVLCRASVDLKDILSSNVSATKENAISRVTELVLRGVPGQLDFGPQEGFSLRWRGETMTLQTPGSKQEGGVVFLDKKILDITGEFHGGRKFMSSSFVFSEDTVDRLITRLYKVGLSAFLSVQDMMTMSKSKGEKSETTPLSP